MYIEYHISVNMYYVSAHGFDERMINVHYYYYCYYYNGVLVYNNSGLVQNNGGLVSYNDVLMSYNCSGLL